MERGRVVRPRRGSVERLAAALGLSATEHSRLGAAVGVPPRRGGESCRPRVGVLGPLLVRRGDRVVDVHGAGPRCLLGLLALRPGQMVSREEIVEVLWDGPPPRACLNQIQVYVGRLRRLLEPECTARTGFRILVRNGGGYGLDPDGVRLDLVEFDTLMARAAMAGDRGQAEAVEHLLAQALACWRGRVLGGAEPRLVQHPAAVAAGSRRVDAALTYAEVVGCHGRAASQVRSVAVDEPLHEGLHARLMLALAADGQQAAALEVFDAIRTRLHDELGIGPGAEIRAAHLRVLRQQVTVDGAGADRLDWGR
jgi:DNA-binding SARP family transcriptional activator